MSRLGDWWRRRLARRRSHVEEISHLTDQFYTTLAAEVARIEAAGAAPAQDLVEVKSLLAADEKSWTAAYRIEQLLVHLYDEPTMELELRRRLEEVKGVASPSLAEWYAAQAKEREEPVDHRALLARLVNDLQWRYMVNEVKRGYSKKITRSSGWILVGTLAVFLLWAMWPFAMDWQRERARRPGEAAPAAVAGAQTGSEEAVAGPTGAERALAGPTGAGEQAEDSEDAEDAVREEDGAAERERQIRLDTAKMHKETWYLLVLAGLAGAWGASFSLLIGLKKRMEESSVNDLKLMGHRATLYSRPLIGGGAALILFFFVAAGLLAGSLFPDFSGSDRTIQNLALLVVLSFIAGFSEKLVPGLLARTEGRIAEPRTEAEQAAPPPPPAASERKLPGPAGEAGGPSRRGDAEGEGDEGGSKAPEGGEGQRAAPV